MVEENKEEIKLEDIFQRLEETLKKLQGGEVTLEESFRLYEAGMKDIEVCNTMLDGIEKKMLVLSQNGETAQLDQEGA